MCSGPDNIGCFVDVVVGVPTDRVQEVHNDSHGRGSRYQSGRDPRIVSLDSVLLEDVRAVRKRYDLVLIDTEDTTWLGTDDLKPWKRVVWSGSRRTLRDVKLVVNPDKPKSFAAKHNRMGGATSAKSIMIWTGEGAEEITLGGEGVFPTRPSGDWINPAAPIWSVIRRKSTDKGPRPVWSAPEEKSFPWPLPQEPFVIEAPSVFLYGKLTQRALTVKEKASLLDLPALWPANVIERVWGWKGGKLLPLRVYVEVLGLCWIGLSLSPQAMKTRWRPKAVGDRWA